MTCMIAILSWYRKLFGVTSLKVSEEYDCTGRRIKCLSRCDVALKINAKSHPHNLERPIQIMPLVS